MNRTMVLSMTAMLACASAARPATRAHPTAAAPSATPRHDAKTPADDWDEGNEDAPKESKHMSVDDAVQRLWFFSPPAKFRPTSAGEKETLPALAGEILSALREDGSDATVPAEWQKKAHEVGFSIQVWTVEGEPFWALVEREADRRGAGAYVFRVAPSSSGSQILLEAPHVYFDLGTENIAASLFFKPEPGVAAPRALFTNTVHRYQNEVDPSARNATNPADVCHNPDHLFTTMTAAFARNVKGSVTIQLHGFADGDPEAKAGLSAGTTMVVSAGMKATTPVSTAVAKALKGVDAGVRLYPEQARALGATTNVQGAALRELDGAGFVHVEMSATTRKGLNLDPEKRAAFGKALFGAVLARAKDGK